jgi:hypothetical protein
MAKRPPRQSELISHIRQAIEEVETLGPRLSKPAMKRTREMLGELRTQLDRVASSLDPIREPATWFDPADLSTAGRLVAAALLAQPKTPLELVPRSYGAGVYAIYYNGDHPAYAPLAGSESPIYVGKADPDVSSAKSPREQGERLFKRLADHRKAIRSVQDYALANGLPSPLRIKDFECRRLVTATNAQFLAERHLIDLFQPVWNSDTKICWGISMHGDTTGRNNDRPPWHVLHPGAKWALRDNIVDSRPVGRIVTDIENHFAAYPAYRDRDAIIEQFMEGFAQDPMAATAPVADEDASTDDGLSEDGKTL